MKRLMLFFIGVLFIFATHAQELEQAQIDFANAFVEVVTSHKRGRILKKIDKKYRKEQIKFLDGNKVQFIDELFGGSDLMTAKWININMLDIQKIEIAEVQKVDDGYRYIFRIRDGKHDLLSSLLLMKQNGKFAFIGGSG